jgi:DNA-binding SARP family transcriptional activator
MPRLSLSLLGPFQIVLDDKPVRSGLWTKTQALLAYLAAEAGIYHRRESLAGLIWPDQPEEAARHSLRQSLVQLRHAIGEGEPPFLCITPQTIQFNTASEHWLDLAEYAALIGECERHAHRRAETCRVCIKRLERAMALYRGDLLADFFLKDSAAFEEWAILKREQLARTALAALHILAKHHALRASYAAMEQAARRQIEIDPFCESAHRQLMRALMWSGQRNAALSHYAALTEMLAKELGIAPDKETCALCEQIEADELPVPQTPSVPHLRD